MSSLSVCMSDMCRHGSVFEAAASAESNINSALLHFITSGPSFKEPSNLTNVRGSRLWRKLLLQLLPAFVCLTRLGWRRRGMTRRCRLCYTATVDMTLHTQAHTHICNMPHSYGNRACPNTAGTHLHICSVVDCIISHRHCHILLQTRYSTVPLTA